MPQSVLTPVSSPVNPSRSISIHLLYLLAALPFFLFPAQADDWKAGIAKVIITPADRIPMAGYANRRAAFEAIDTDLYAKALALEDAAGHRALLITADLLGFPNALCERIADRLKSDTGIERKAILFNGSHTHSAPVISDQSLSGIEPQYHPAVRQYLRMLEGNIVAIGRSALKSLQPVSLSWGKSVDKFVFNRREFTDRGIILGINPLALADRTVPVLRVQRESGDTLAIVFGAAAHNTTLSGRHMNINGDYAGYAQAEIEQRHPGAQAMFVLGCAGDAAPVPRGELSMAQDHGSHLADQVLEVLAQPMKPIQGPLQTDFRRIDLPLQRFTQPEIEIMAESAPSYRQYFTSRALEILKKGDPLPATYNAPLALWKFGRDLTLVAFSGETLVDYAKGAEDRLGPLNLWVAGYSNDLFGYLPPKHVIEEGGYESRGLYMGVGLFAAEVEEIVLNAIEEMAQAAGRSRP